MSELLSICIPTYNRAIYLQELLDVLLEEMSELTDPNSIVKIYISDNASEDETKQVVANYSNRISIDYFRNETNLGPQENMYRLLNYAKGDFVWIFGDDDLIKKGSLKKIINILIERKPGLLILLGDSYDPGVPLPAEFSDFHDFAKKFSVVNPYMLIAHSLLTCNIFLRSCIDLDYCRELVKKNNLYFQMYILAAGLKNITAPVIIPEFIPIVVREHGRSVNGLRPRAIDTTPPINNMGALWNDYLCFVSENYSIKELSHWAKRKYPKSQDVDIIINYYNPDRRDDLYYQTLYCISCYKQNGDSYIILSDGSGFKDERLIRLSEEMHFIYLWSERKLSFAEGYNQGIDYSLTNSSAKFICLSANDIFVSLDSISKLLRIIATDDAIGCVIPYLSFSDYPPQNDCYLNRLRYCDGMTLNVNLFRKQDLEKIGKVPEYLSGYFNDVVMFAELKKLSKKVVLCNASKIFHLGKSTVNKSTTSSFAKDKEIFIKRHPDLAPKNPHLDVRYSAFSQTYSSIIFSCVLDNCKSMYLTWALLRFQLAYLTGEKIIFMIIKPFYIRLKRRNQ